MFKIIFVLVGTFVGAGFASGKEIYLFFARYGINGFLGIILCSILLGILCISVILCYPKKILMLIYNIKNTVK